MPRPIVPDWIRTFEPPPGWTNVFAMVPSNKRLYGTETLFGDWDGRTLLLAKDGAPTPVIQALRDRGDPDPWRHAQRELGDSGGYRTNENLATAASALPGGKLNGSATANLLLDDPRWSRSLPGFYSGPLHDYLRRVLTWVLETMPNVERVACLGQEAWFLTSIAFGRADVSRKFSVHRDSCQPLTGTCGGKKLSAFALYHPAARVLYEAKSRGWAAMTGGSTAHVDALHNERNRIEVAPDRIPKMEIQVSTEWIDTPFTRNKTIEPPKGKVHPGILNLLKEGGAKGVSWGAFSMLPWKKPFEVARLYKAMNEIANDYGYMLQYQGVKPSPSRWRISS